jgi:8-oxo-dGTP pyrophosphatase MutT (NUDIX family)
MRIRDLYENDSDHAEALQQTGFWGRAGAGVLFQARDTGRILIAHRSDSVEQPNTWGTWGGAIDENENPMTAAMREAAEETGTVPDQQSIVPMYVFSHPSGFRYFNFLVITNTEFEPRLNWESQGFGWFDFGEWPKPLHPGTADLLNDQKSLSIMKMNAQ